MKLRHRPRVGPLQVAQGPDERGDRQECTLGGDAIDTGIGKVEGYSPHERKEVHADVFAGEFFCPADWIRDQYVEHRKRPSEVAAELGLPPDLVLNQFIRAYCFRRSALRLRNFQKSSTSSMKASGGRATWSDGPLLVDAGPGTRKDANARPADRPPPGGGRVAGVNPWRSRFRKKGRRGDARAAIRDGPRRRDRDVGWNVSLVRT